MAKSNEPQNAFPTGGVFSEPQLVVPALFVMARQKQNVTTTTLIEELTRLLKPTGDDAKILSGRGDSHFSQKVRNLKSHNTLSRRGLARHTSGRWRITRAGLQFLQEGESVLASLKDQGFPKQEVKEIFDEDYDKILIEEGQESKSLCSNTAITERV